MKTFEVEDFGQVGEANLIFGVQETKGKHFSQLEVNESCEVRLKKNIHKIRRKSVNPLLRVTRIS